jgi:putative DNA primase/helicase
MTMTTYEALQHFQHVKRAGPGKWMARCPAHEDRNPSLSISEKDGKTLLKCHAGCSTESIVFAAGLHLSDLFADSVKPQRQIVATYDYTDESGGLLYQAVRFDPKDFRQRRPDGKGAWVWNLDGSRRVLYHLPEVLQAKWLLVVEGEKDVLTAGKLGLVATCNPMGAGKWQPDYSQPLKGKPVAIIADNDPAGLTHAHDVARSLVVVADRKSVV